MGTKKIKETNRPPNRRKIEGLTYKQRMFVRYLLADKDFNLTRAARKAGYKKPSMAARECIDNPVVAKMVGHAIAERSNRLKVKADRVLLELARIGFSDPRELVDSEGRLIPLQDLPEDVARSISSVKLRTTKDKDGKPVTTVEVRFWDKLRALELLAKHLGLLHEKIQVNHDVSGALESLLQSVEEQRRNVVDAEAIKKRIDAE